ncbi:MAG: hypothetical protein QM808_06615 [Steroidobacteraceae bacterium]
MKVNRVAVALLVAALACLAGCAAGNAIKPEARTAEAAASRVHSQQSVLSFQQRAFLQSCRQTCSYAANMCSVSASSADESWICNQRVDMCRSTCSL